MNLGTFWASDICWCTFQECPYKECFRHLHNLPKNLQYYTAGNLKGTDSCTNRFKFTKGGRIKSAKRIPTKKYQKKQACGTGEQRKDPET